jgi:hypothetical protein
MKTKATGKVIRKWSDKKDGWYTSAAVRLDASPDHTDGKVVTFLAHIEHHISLGLIGKDDLVEIEFETYQPPSGRFHVCAENEVTLLRMTVLKFADQKD